MKNNQNTNEFCDCLNRYFNKETNVDWIDSISGFANEFFIKSNEIIIRDNPDGYLKIDNKVIIIEHFEYDATKNNKKGSETRIELSRIKRKLNITTDENNCVYDQMQVTHSTEQLRDNFIKVFEEHNSKINQYKQELIKDGIAKDESRIIIIFCCEDKTTFGCLDNEMFAFSIVDIKECLDTILKSDVDYLLLCNTYQNDKYMKLLPVSNELLSISKNKLAKDIKMIDFKPKVIGAKFMLDK